MPYFFGDQWNRFCDDHAKAIRERDALQADLAALRERCEQLRAALLVVRAHVDQWGELSCTDTAWSALVTALRYYAADAAKQDCDTKSL